MKLIPIKYVQLSPLYIPYSASSAPAQLIQPETDFNNKPQPSKNYPFAVNKELMIEDTDVMINPSLTNGNDEDYGRLAKGDY
jgi:hypothetical protein